MGITAHSAVYCFGLNAPPGATVSYHVCILQELRAADLAAPFLYEEWLALTRLAQPCCSLVVRQVLR